MTNYEDKKLNILAIETTGAEASVAFISENGNVFEESSKERLNHLQNLMPMIDKLLIKCKLTIDDISHIAVSEGPGSFTGIRIGVSSARALAQCLGVETIGVPTLKTFAFATEVCVDGTILCPIFDARRSQVYSGGYLWEKDADGKAQCKQHILDDAYDLGELLTLLEPYEKVKFFGDGIDVYEEEILQWRDRFHEANLNSKKQVFFAGEEERTQRASWVAKLAYLLQKEGNCKSFFDLKPVYLRKAEAERKLEESLKIHG